LSGDKIFQVGLVVFLLGHVSFISDISVARDRFNKEYRSRLIGLPWYYLSQFLLAFSAGL
jgi:hypothetical protein